MLAERESQNARSLVGELGGETTLTAAVFPTRRSGTLTATKVTRVALQNAASIAGLMVTTECMVIEIPEKEKIPPMPPGGGGMGDMY